MSGNRSLAGGENVSPSGLLEASSKIGRRRAPLGERLAYGRREAGAEDAVFEYHAIEILDRLAGVSAVPEFREEGLDCQQRARRVTALTFPLWVKSNKLYSGPIFSRALCI